MEFMACVDVGGTFTDLHLVDQEGDTNSFKASSTPENPADGVFSTLDKASQSYGVSMEEFASSIDFFTHGTTVSTNAIIENETDKTALICTEGFRDTLWLREGAKEEPYNWQMDYPDPYVPRKLTFGVEERINADGEIVTELNKDQVRETIDQIKNYDVDSVAVALLWSQVNPIHEQRIGEILDETAPNLDHSLSHHVNPILREYRRTSSTVIDASLYSTMQSYISDLKQRLEEQNLSAEPLMLASNGGVLPFDEAASSPIWTVDSGPTLLPVGVHKLSQQDIGKNNIIAIDMGGTSLDIGVIEDGRVPRTREATVGNDYMLGIEKVDVRSIGSGGGSIAWVDEGELLHVGPKSAGSDPGPICYLRGGKEPTVTDAAISLGYYNEDYFLGGDMDVSRDAAIEGIEAKLSPELGVSPVEAANSIYKTTTENIVQGIRGMTVERGIDPRNYILSGGGGAVGAFTVPVARELGIDEIYLPKDAGVVSAVGGVLTDIKQDFSTSYYTLLSGFNVDKVNDILTSLESEAQSFFDDIGVSENKRSYTFYTEARYLDQTWELEIEIPSHISEDNLSKIEQEFHEVHKNTHGYKTDDEIEFLYWRLEGVGKTADPNLTISTHSTSEDATSAKVDERKAHFNESMVTTSIYRSSRLNPGHELTGPAIIEEETTTMVLPPESEAKVTELGNFHIMP